MTATALPADARPDAAPDALAPPPRHPRFPLIDGMRAIAVAGVVLVHAGVMGRALGPSLPGRLLAHLNIGVTLFFLISGFLLYRPMIAHRGGGPSAPRRRDYARRRVLRIYPAYLLVLVVLLILPLGPAGIVGPRWEMFTLVHALAANGGQRCSSQILSCGLAQTWSLVVEATFYLALPLYALAVGQVTRRLDLTGWVAAEISILAAVSLASVLLQFALLTPAPTWVSGSVVGYCTWFGLGMGLAVASVAAEGGLRAPGPVRRLTRAPGTLWVLAAATYLGLSLWLPPSPFLFSTRQLLVTHLVFGLVATLLIAPAVFGGRGDGAPRRFLAHPLVAWLGLVSYGIFLWHYAVALELGSPGAGGSFLPVLLGTVAITVPIAAASYYLLERPVLRLK